MTQFEKIKKILKKKKTLCDDCLSTLANVKPRQTINRICNTKAREGQINRKEGKCSRCKKVKKVNSLKKIKNQTSTVSAKPQKIKNLPELTHKLPADNQFGGFIREFSSKVQSGDIEIYNEFSLQHELGIFLRSKYPSRKIQFERNVTYFGFNKSKFSKKEIDISIFNNRNELDSIIELKFPRNGQHPEQMYSFCKDIAFAEELRRAGFERAYLLIFAEDPLFYTGGTQGIYGYFRGGKILRGTIPKPTGKRTSQIQLQGQYQITWQPVSGNLKYTLIEV